MTDLHPEDAKIVTLARGARSRAHAPHTGVAEALPSEADLAVLREFGVGVPVHLAGDDGAVRGTITT